MERTQGGQARVMTWNIWWRFGPRWKDRQPALVETLRRVDPDIVALQEVWATDGMTQANEFGELLGLQAGFASPSYPAAPEPPQIPDHAGVKLGLGVLSRWPIISLEPVEDTRPASRVGTHCSQGDSRASGWSTARRGGLLGV
jgi:endonuclease/exonuclease/phosphatase family metal-dependent hydrolase